MSKQLITQENISLGKIEKVLGDRNGVFTAETNEIKRMIAKEIGDAIKNIRKNYKPRNY